MRGGRWRWWRGEGSQRKRSLHAWMRQTLGHLEPMCDVQEMSVTTQNNDYEDCNTTRTLTCSSHCWVSCCASCCFSGSWFSRFHWCWTSHRSAGWVFSSTAFHHAYAIPSVTFFSSGCCSPTLSCHRPLNLYPKFLHVSHRENGSFRLQ